MFINKVSTKKPAVGITTGDPAGIGPEVVLKALEMEDIADICTPQAIGSKSILEKTARELKLTSIDKFKIHDIELPENVEIKPGKTSKYAGLASYNYVLKSIEMLKRGEIEAIVTGPVTKASLFKASVPFLDHTEIFDDNFNGRAVTLLATQDLMVSHVMRHVSLANAIRGLTEDKIFSTIVETCNALNKTFDIKFPRIIVAGLNPHNGDKGLMGDEEKTIITPAIERAKAEGIQVRGPVAADSAFPIAIEGGAVVVVAMFHDQGHIAVKSHNWKKSHGITAGLDLIRTSVDHGSALDIAGRGIAYEDSLVEAIKAAVKLCKITEGK